ncbi:MAG: ABC transporter permease [Sulfolobales archaeon]
MIVREIVRRTILILIIFLAVLTFQFFLFRAVIPDPTIIYIREGLGPEEREIIKKSFGLDKPLYEQYLLYIYNFLRGDMGYSFYYKMPVSSIIFERLLNTLVLFIPAVVTAFLISRYLGSYMAWRRGSLIEKSLITAFSMLNSLPLFWVSLLAIMLFSINLKILPSGGMRTPPYQATGFLDKIMSLDFLWHWILPYAVLTLYTMINPTLLMRSSMITTLGEDFITVLRAVGLSERRIMREASRVSIIPLVTQLGISTGFAFAGSVAFETVFSWPGIGREIVIAFNNLDYPLAQGIFAVMTLAIIVINTLIDIAYVYLDPRTRRR